MLKHTPIVFLISIALFGSQILTGCDQAPVEKPVKLASRADVLQANIAKAKTILDQLKKLPKAERQSAANKPRTASTLKAASADPDTKTRMDDLGITIE